MKLQIITLSIILSVFNLYAQERFSVLVFFKTNGFRHESIPSGIAAIQKLGEEHNFRVVATEDADYFSLPNLSLHHAVIFLCTTGDVLNTQQQTAFQQYIGQGGGYVGVHAASDTEYGWPWYGGLVGAYFDSHPPGTPAAVVKVSDHVHPSTAHLPDFWQRTDEWYNFDENPRGKVHVLATLDEKSYSGGNMGTDHPFAWCHSYSGGRSWYTAGGHTKESYQEPDFLKHLYGGILYATGTVRGEFDATVEENFQMTVINNNPNQPIILEVLPDDKILYLERWGALQLYDPETGNITLAGSMDVDFQREDGLIGLVLDPDFKNNHWIYLFYSPLGNEPVQRVSRFNFDNNQLQKASEKILLTIPVQRQECCHSGGDLKFDADGNLYIALGDNTNPFDSDGYAPMDERPGRSSFDAQRTSGNTQDLRGKILRIKPMPDGTYTVPEGNLFTDPSIGRPEIYTMGNRNPFRISIDKKNNLLYWGEVGPDASTNTGRGPKGYDEINRTATAGNFGWPYCIADNQSYADYNFSNFSTGAFFNCESPVNNSPNNTGSSILPSAKSAWIWYPYISSPEFPELGSLAGRTSMAGPVYDYDSSSVSAGGLPAYFDNSVFIYDWSNNWVKEVKQDSNGSIISINPILTKFRFARPIDIKAGPDGSLYIVEWGTGYFGDNPDARIVKISYQPGGKNPVAVIKAIPESGTLPLQVTFSATDSYDEDPGSTLSYHWDFQNDGIEDATGVSAQYIYTASGVYNVKLRVSDNTGKQAFTVFKLVAGNSKPTVKIESPLNGGFFSWGDSLPYKILVSDTEDGSTTSGSINCTDVSITPAIGHNDHGHDENSLPECEGVFVSPEGHGSGDTDNIFYLLNASYTDKGVAGNHSLSLTAQSTSVFRLKRLQAEFLSTKQESINKITADKAGGGGSVRIANQDFLKISPANFSGIHHVTYRLSATASGYIEIHADSLNGQVVSRTVIAEANTEFEYYSSPVMGPAGTRDFYFVFRTDENSIPPLFDLNWIDFYGNGIAMPHLEKEGLLAAYYNSSDFTGPSVKRMEPLVSHFYEDQHLLDEIRKDNFSIKWKGILTPPVTGEYVFSLPVSNGNAILSLDGAKVSQSGENETKANLTGGNKYKLELNYTHTTGDAAVKLKWKYGNNPAHVIPQQFLSPEDTILTALDVEEKNGSGFRIYPNPASGNFYIESSSSGVYKAQLLDITGRKVKDSALKEAPGSHIIQIEGIPSGIYLIRITSENEQEQLHKVVIR